MRQTGSKNVYLEQQSVKRIEHGPPSRRWSDFLEGGFCVGMGQLNLFNYLMFWKVVAILSLTSI